MSTMDRSAMPPLNGPQHPQVLAQLALQLSLCPSNNETILPVTCPKFFWESLVKSRLSELPNSDGAVTGHNPVRID